MRKMMMVLMLCGCCGGAAAAWVAVPNGDASTFYADPATLQKSGNFVRMAILLDYKKAQLRDTLDERNRSYQSIKSLSEFDCKEIRWRRLNFTQHSSAMGLGATINSNPVAGMWEPASAAGAAGGLWKIACAKK
ncbi:MAG: surface-adhesin E family protein [Betaproteobacteria bacterium]|jgi:hypothetical protein